MKTYKIYYTCTNELLEKYCPGPVQLNALFCAENEEKAREMATERLKRVRTSAGRYRELVSIDKVEEYDDPSVSDLLTKEEIEKIDKGEVEEFINNRGVLYRKVR